MFFHESIVINSGVILLARIADVRMALSENGLVNQATQDCSTEPATADVEAFRHLMLRVFYKRSARIILCFVLVKLAWFFGR